MRTFHAKIKDVPNKESFEYAQMHDVYDEKCNKALNEVEKTFTRRAYDYVAIANPDNGVQFFNMCVRHTGWCEKINRFTINKLTELGRCSLPADE